MKKVVLYQVKQLNHILLKQSPVLPHSHLSYATDFSTEVLASVISSQPFRRLNLSPPTYYQRFWIYVDRLT